MWLCGYEVATFQNNPQDMKNIILLNLEKEG